MNDKKFFKTDIYQHIPYIYERDIVAFAYLGFNFFDKEIKKKT